MKLKKIKVAIDSPSAAGAGTISKMLAGHYNLLYCDTGKIYRYLAKKLMSQRPKNKIKYLNILWCFLRVYRTTIVSLQSIL